MALFEDKAPKIMVSLLKDFPDWTFEDAAAVVGNLGYETAGFEKLQEIKPTVAGSRGGYGWPQWTGPRRVLYEAYCKRNNLDPASDVANYKYLFVELKGPEKKAIKAVEEAVGLYNKTVAFEKSFERAGIKNHDGRFKYAQRALKAYEASDKTTGIVPSSGTVSPLVINTSIAGGVVAAIVAVLKYFGVI